VLALDVVAVDTVLLLRLYMPFAIDEQESVELVPHLDGLPHLGSEVTCGWQLRCWLDLPGRDCRGIGLYAVGSVMVPLPTMAACPLTTTSMSRPFSLWAVPSSMLGRPMATPWSIWMW
jgi:hypothetical protein